MDTKNILFADESYKIMGACFNVYKDKGCGFLEAVYHECLGIELKYQQIPFVSKKELSMEYRDQKLKQTYKADFICFDKIIVEIKAVSRLIDEHRSQVLNYIHAANFELGLLINFGHYPKLEYERFALTEKKVSTKN